MSDNITDMLHAWTDGRPEALEELVPAVQHELRRLAEAHLSRERRHHTLQPTALLNEAYLRLLNQKRVQWQNRTQFFAIASRIMRRVLVDYARRRSAKKRAVADRVTCAFGSDPTDVIDLHEALLALSEIDPRQAQIVELMFFGGLTVGETAEVLDVSPTTVKREWRVAKLWLYQRMRPD